MGSGGIRGQKVGSRGFQRGVFSKKRVGSNPPSSGFYNIKGRNTPLAARAFRPLASFCNFFVEFYQPSGKNFLIFPSLVSDFCENPNERQTRSCLSQTGAGFLFHLDPPSWPVPPLLAACQEINDDLDVDGLCRRLPDRIRELIDAKGERLMH